MVVTNPVGSDDDLTKRVWMLVLGSARAAASILETPA